MEIHGTSMQRFIAEEVAKVRGKYVAVRAGLFERGMVQTVSIQKLHPNPDDEFCMPGIGPNEEIVARYEKDFLLRRRDRDAARYLDTEAFYALEVQKIRPDGYLILNGHHRWLAAVRAGIPRLPVRIVNLMSEKDVEKALEFSSHEMRITLDLEEIVFAPDAEGGTEKPLHFPLNMVYKERLRLGIPALFAYCAAEGYDVWLYSSGYESVDYLREMMKCYRTQITGIIIGAARRGPKNAAMGENIEKLMRAKYVRTVHPDNSTVLVVDSRTDGYREYPLSGGAWSAEVMEIIRGMKQNEKAAE